MIHQTHTFHHVSANDTTTPTNYTVTIINRFGNTISAPVVYVADLAF